MYGRGGPPPRGGGFGFGGRGRGRGGGPSNNLLPAITGLPMHIKAMFEPRPPIDFARPMKKPKIKAYTGVSDYVNLFEKTEPPTREVFVSHKDRKISEYILDLIIHLQHAQAKEKEALMKAHEEQIKMLLEDWDPKKNPKATEDPYKTLFVARISYDTTEKKLKREFEQFGPIKSIRMIQSNDAEPRGYAFIEYEREQDMKTAYKRGDGKKIDGRRVLVDVERGRTVKGWKPRRLGGGLGGTRKDKEADVKPPQDDGGSRGDRESSRRRSRSRSRDRHRERDRDRDKRRRSGSRSRSGERSRKRERY